MSIGLREYDSALRYGAVIRGTYFSTQANYASVSANTNGTLVQNLLPTQSTAVFNGTITNMNIIAGDTTAGTIDLVSDQGTLIRLIKSGTKGGSTGSMITPIPFVIGSLLQIVSAGTDNANVEVVFYTFN